MKCEDYSLVVVDVQEKLAAVMHDRDRLIDNLCRLIKGCQALEIPCTWMEQIPDKMGPTVEPVRELLTGEMPMAKRSFSCCGEPAFVARLQQLDRKHVLLAGIETHVCVFQTAADLTAAGYRVEVVSDSTSSRTPENRDVGLEKVRACGATLTSVETALFELMRTAAHPAFREILSIVK